MLYSTETGPVPLIDIGDEEQKEILIENAKQKALGGGNSNNK